MIRNFFQQTLNRRFFEIAGITVCVESELDFDQVKFKPEFAPFMVEGPGDDNVIFRHHFELPNLNSIDPGKTLYNKPPWAISRKDDAWFYCGLSPSKSDPIYSIAIFNKDHTRAEIYNKPYYRDLIRLHEWQSLSLFPTDQIWLSPLLADRNAVLLHSAGVIMNGHGLLFVGHSSAGKSTITTLLKDAASKGICEAEILCDDRNAARRWPDGWRIHGTWSHGDVADVSGAGAPLRAVLFLEKGAVNEIIPLSDRKSIWCRLLATLIRPLVTAEWLKKELDVLERMVREVPCYVMRFDKSGQIVDELLDLVNSQKTIGHS